MKSRGNIDTTTWGWLRMEMTESSSYLWYLQLTNWEGQPGEPLNGSEVQKPGWFITCTHTPTNIRVLANLILRLPIMFLYLKVLLVKQSYIVESIIWGYHIYEDIWTNSSLLMRGSNTHDLYAVVVVEWIVTMFCVSNSQFVICSWEEIVEGRALMTCLSWFSLSAFTKWYTNSKIFSCRTISLYSSIIRMVNVSASGYCRIFATLECEVGTSCLWFR